MRSRWPILVLLCVLAILLVPGIASAHSVAGAENRVRVFGLPEQVHVGAAAALTLDPHLGGELAEYDFASDSLLAAKGGWKAAPRPKGVPSDWVAKPSKTGGGTRFVDPSNPHNSVRVMPGNPNSPFPNSQGPYVRVTRNGQAIDNAGNVVPKDSPAAHIPLKDFKFPN